MKTLMIILSIIFFGWPALIVGYLVAAIKSGYTTGIFVYNSSEDEVLEERAKVGMKE